jgi:hypothetical protein
MAPAMPGAAHETLVTLFGASPELLFALMRALGHTPPTGPLRTHDSTVRLANPLEVRPDLILLTPGDTGPWLAVEVQHGKDDDKPRRWLALAAALHDTRKHMGDLVVVTHDAAVARWASKEIHLTGPSGTRVAIQPLVLCVTRKEAEQLLATGVARPRRRRRVGRPRPARPARAAHRTPGSTAHPRGH